MLSQHFLYCLPHRWGRLNLQPPVRSPGWRRAGLPGPSGTWGCTIHRSAWNRNSQKFAVAISPSTPHSDGYRGGGETYVRLHRCRHLFAAGNIHNFAYLSIGVTSSSGTGDLPYPQLSRMALAVEADEVHNNSADTMLRSDGSCVSGAWPDGPR